MPFHFICKSINPLAITLQLIELHSVTYYNTHIHTQSLFVFVLIIMSSEIQLSMIIDNVKEEASSNNLLLKQEKNNSFESGKLKMWNRIGTTGEIETDNDFEVIY